MIAAPQRLRAGNSDPLPALRACSRRRHLAHRRSALAVVRCPVCGVRCPCLGCSLERQGGVRTTRPQTTAQIRDASIGTRDRFGVAEIPVATAAWKRRRQQHREYPQTFRVLHNLPPVVWTVRLLRWRYLALAARDIPDPDKRYLATNATPEPLIGNRLWPCRGVGPDCEAESVRSMAQRDKSGPGSQTAAAGGLGPLNKGCERRTRALPDVSAGGERHDRFGVRSRGRGRQATDRGSFRSGGSVPKCSRYTLLACPAQVAILRYACE